MAKPLNEIDIKCVKSGLEKISHRGPDASRIEYNSSGVHGHNRLSIIGSGDLGRQPLKTKRGGLLTYNGEIYNYQELAKKYLTHVNTHYLSDTEVLGDILDIYGDEIISELEGMFAFVYSSSNSQVIVSRDKFGIKPLYYFSDNEKIYFSSEIKAFPVRLVVDSAAFKSYLSLGRYPTSSEGTFFKTIKSIPPGGIVLIDQRIGGWVEKQLNWNRRDENINGLELQHVLDKMAVDISVSDVPICFSLSGGIDSNLALVSCLKNSKNHKKLFEAIVCRPFSDEFSEVEFAKNTARFCNVKLHECRPFEKNSISIAEAELKRLTNVLEAPIRSPGIFMQEAVYRKARELGFKVIIDGEGADDLLAAYYGNISQTLADLMIEDGLKSWFNQLSKFCKRTDHSLIKVLAKSIIGLSQNSVHNYWNEETNSCRILEMCKLVSTVSLPNLLLYGDRLSMANSLESRPFYLQSIFRRYCLSKRSSELIKDGFNKYPLRIELGKTPGLESVAWNVKKRGYSTEDPYPNEIYKKISHSQEWADYLKSLSIKRNEADSKWRALEVGAYYFWLSYK